MRAPNIQARCKTYNIRVFNITTGLQYTGFEMGMGIYTVKICIYTADYIFSNMLTLFGPKYSHGIHKQRLLLL